MARRPPGRTGAPRVPLRAGPLDAAARRAMPSMPTSNPAPVGRPSRWVISSLELPHRVGKEPLGIGHLCPPDRAIGLMQPSIPRRHGPRRVPAAAPGPVVIGRVVCGAAHHSKSLGGNREASRPSAIRRPMAVRSIAAVTPTRASRPRARSSP